MTYQIVPESAPFSIEQRAWLNGFLAGVLGVLDQQSAQGGSATTLAAAASLLSPPLGAGLPVDQKMEESFPWHDPALPLPERMTLSDGMPHEQRLMSAMAQLNCGSCGYLCKTYSEAIANGSEKNLTLCSPGGSETAKALRTLVKEAATQTSSSGKGLAKSIEIAPPTVVAKGTRDNPVEAKLIASDKLNDPGSAKDTRHVVIDLEGSGLNYRVGDALGLWPTNCLELASEVVESAGLDASIAELLKGKCLRTIPPELLEVSIEVVRSRPKQNGAVAMDAELISRLEAFEESDELYEWDVLEFFQSFSSLGLTATQIVNSLNDQRPRLYSIASSQSLYPKEVHLTVGRVENCIRNRNRKGVASTMLADRLKPSSSIRVFIQPSHGFTIPDDSNAPMIMVGPGTGIAPFIAFLQQRQVDQATGRNWLFFGDQKKSTDFLYREQLETWQNGGLLTKLDLAFSRDGADKVYVQHRMLEQGAELYSWLESGAYFFVCGDASKMAIDVDRALQEVIAVHGKKSAAEAKQYLAAMTNANRYVRDVY
jgi:sulfite reductase (NADPH) flavoprotein alpha-component